MTASSVLLGLPGDLFGSKDEGNETCQRSRQPHEGVLEKFGGRESQFDVHFKAFVEEVLEDRGQLAALLDVGFAVCGDEVQGLLSSCTFNKD